MSIWPSTLPVTSYSMPSAANNLLHVNMGDLGADGHVQRRLAPVFDFDLRPCEAVGQAKDRRECEVSCHAASGP